MKKIWIHSSTKVAINTVVFLALCVMPGSGKCKPDEVEIFSKDPLKGFFCKACRSCPPGYGPSHQCSGRYLNGTKITCKPCVSGISYSEEQSIASCQPCQQCGGKETLQKCTPKSETSCSNKCRVGYKMNHAVEECIQDPSFTKTSLTSPLPKSTTIPKTTTNTSMTQDGNTQRETHGTTNPFHPDTSGRDGQSKSKDSDHSKDNKIMLTVICVFIIMAIVVFAMCFLHKKYLRRDNASNQDEEKALTMESPRTSQEIVPWSNNLRLRDIPVQPLRSIITNQISKESTVVNYWLAIGEELGLSPTDLEAIDVAGQKNFTNQGEQLLIKLASWKPELTLTEFVNTLENLGRKDVSTTIKDYYNQKLNTAIQTEGVPQNNQQPDHFELH